MKKDTYMTLLGLRDVCYNDFNFDIDNKNPFLGTDTYKKIEEILKKNQTEELLKEFEVGANIYQDYAPEYLSLTNKHEIEHDINAAREYINNYSDDKDDFKKNYQAFIDDNSLSYAFGPDDNLDQVQKDLNNVDTENVIVWERRKNEYLLLPHSFQSLERIKNKISSVKNENDKAIRLAMEKLFNNINEFLKPFSKSQYGKYEKDLPEDLRMKLEHEALLLQNDARDVGAEKLAKKAEEIARKANNDVE